MKRVNYYLKKAEPDTGLSLIYLQAKYAGQRLVFTFNEKVKPSSWNPKKQRVKAISQTSADGRYLLNDYLDSIEKFLISAYNAELKNGIPGPEKLRTMLRDFVNRSIQKEVVSNKVSLMDIIDRFLANEIGDIKRPNTIKRYKTVKNHLLGFAKKYHTRVNFEDVNIEFRDRYVRYLTACGLKRNSIAKDISIIKFFMNYSFEEGFTQNSSHQKRKFKLSEVETESVYLTENEVLKLFRADLAADKPLERVRDLFVIGCFVGLRFGDYSNRIKPENIVTHDGEMFISLITQKTGAKVVVPIHPVVLEILNKYNSALPKAISNQPFNRAIKDACRAAKLTEKGRLTSDPDKQLCDCVSSHTARRSFATNYYLQGFPVYDLMKVTGHKTEKAFLRYIKADKLESAKRLGIHIKKNWAEKVMRVAG